VSGWWFSTGPLASSTNKTDCHDMTEILLKVALNTMKPTTLYDSPTSGEPAMLIDLVVGFMVFNATFNNISVISWQSVLLVEETRGPGENHRPVASHQMSVISDVIVL
jgi:hypothetical protein